LKKKKPIKKEKGNNNTIHVLLTFNCSKLLCMISKSEKASLIRNYYIDLEKLIITYKDNIVNDLNNQLGIQTNNKKIIENNNKTGLIYILKVDDETYKLGNSNDIKKRMKQYNVGRINELPIVFVFKSNNIVSIENCIKKNLSDYRVKKHKNNELFKIDDEFIKKTIIYCNSSNIIKIKENKKLYNSNDNKNWLIIIDKNNTNINELFKEVKKYKKKSKISKKK
jgi:hypothetical protein